MSWDGYVVHLVEAMRGTYFIPCPCKTVEMWVLLSFSGVYLWVYEG